MPRHSRLSGWNFPLNFPCPPDYEIKNAVRRLALSDLLAGMQTCLVIISNEDAKPTSQKAMKCICGAAWGIKEKENPDQAFHPTDRRQRNAEKRAQQ